MHMRRLLGLLLSVVLLGVGCKAFQIYTKSVHGKILCMFATYNVESFRYHLRLAHILADSHDVTVVGVLPLPKVYRQPNFKYVYIGALVPNERFSPSNRFVKLYNQWQQYPELGKYFERFMKAHPPGTFNLVILAYFYNIRHLMLAGCYRVPIILTTETGPSTVINWEVGNPGEEGYLPSEFSETWGVSQSYVMRLIQVIVDKLFEHYFFGANILYYRQPDEKPLHFNCRNVRLWDVRNNITLVFTNHHFTQGPIRPNVPAIVEIGGIQIPEHSIPLEQHIANHINKAENGFIYINLGKSSNCTDLPKLVIDSLYYVLIESEMYVLWRWTLCSKPRHSPKILYTRWMPQNEILAQKNVKLFITHGSMSSLAEGQYHAVPMLGITYLSEQIGNVEYLAQYRLALHIDAHQTNTHEIRSKFFDMLIDPSYKARIMVYSRVYRDRQLTPRATVLYWVNYVLRYGGTPHMRSPAADMTQIQMLGLDLVIVTLSCIILIWKFHSFLWHCITGRIFATIRKFLRKYLFAKDYEIVIDRVSNIRYDEAVVDKQRECQIRPQVTTDADVPRVVPVGPARQRRSTGGRRKR